MMDEFCPLAEAARRMGMSYQGVARALSQQRLAGFRIGRHWFVYTDAMPAFMRERVVYVKPHPPTGYCTVADAQKMVAGVWAATIRKALARGQLRGLRDHRLWYVCIADIPRWRADAIRRRRGVRLENLAHSCRFRVPAMNSCPLCGRVTKQGGEWCEPCRQEQAGVPYYSGRSIECSL